MLFSDSKMKMKHNMLIHTTRQSKKQTKITPCSRKLLLSTRTQLIQVGRRERFINNLWSFQVMDCSISNSIVICHNAMPLPKVEQSHKKIEQKNCGPEHFQCRSPLRRKLLALGLDPQDKPFYFSKSPPLFQYKQQQNVVLSFQTKWY